MFCYQQNFFTPTKQVDEAQFWALVGAPYTKECIDKFRETGDAAWKKRLPAFIFQATFDETLSKKGMKGTWRKQAATQLTGLVVMDIDHIDNPRELFERMRREHPEVFDSKEAECLLSKDLEDSKDEGYKIPKFQDSLDREEAECLLAKDLEDSKDEGYKIPKFQDSLDREEAECLLAKDLKDSKDEGYKIPKFQDSLDREEAECFLSKDLKDSKDEGTENKILKIPESLDKEKGGSSEIGGILLVYITPSGKGLKVVFKARTEWGNLIDNQHKMSEILGVEIDEACKDASRMSFICKESDILYIDKELFTYENKEFSDRFTALYRDGRSQATGKAKEAECFLSKDLKDSKDEGTENKILKIPESLDKEEGGPSYHGVAYTKIIEAWLDGKQPQQGDRHNTLLKLASDLRYITDNNAKRMKEILMQQPWVVDLVNEGENLDTLIKSAQEWKMFQSIPKRFRMVLIKAGVELSALKAENDGGYPLPLEEWGQKIKEFFEDYPCLREVCGQLNPQCWPAAIFTASAFMGTLMTRTWYYFYHRPEERRRLNYCIMVIGDPASGKSFATRLYKLLAAPIKSADKVGYDAINRYKRERQERTTSTKAQKGEALKKPEVIIRDHPARTSNATFIDDMNRAVEMVGGEPMHLHMLTFDSELDNATTTQRGGSWIDKSAMELKAFHNEEDGQAYSNLESVSGTFNVYWNFVYTGTPLSLQRKVSERNFGSGLATRLAVIPLPPSGFQMMELHRTTKKDQAADELLKTWAFHLDKVQGELPLWPLVEHCWEWTRDHMEIAAFNDDKVDELLMKRVPYYGICISAPFILMRHWEEWKEKKTFEIDDKDKELCTLALDIQYYCQHRFFGKMAQMYFDNMEKDEADNKRSTPRFDLCYQQLPETFNLEDVEKVFKVSRSAARAYCSRMKKTGSIDALNLGQFKKLKKTLV